MKERSGFAAAESLKSAEAAVPSIFRQQKQRKKNVCWAPLVPHKLSVQYGGCFEDDVQHGKSSWLTAGHRHSTNLVKARCPSQQMLFIWVQHGKWLDAWQTQISCTDDGQTTETAGSSFAKHFVRTAPSSGSENKYGKELSGRGGLHARLLPVLTKSSQTSRSQACVTGKARHLLKCDMTRNVDTKKSREKRKQWQPYDKKKQKKTPNCSFRKQWHENTFSHSRGATLLTSKCSWHLELV